MGGLRGDVGLSGESERAIDGYRGLHGETGGPPGAKYERKYDT